MYTSLLLGTLEYFVHAVHARTSNSFKFDFLVIIKLEKHVSLGERAAFSFQDFSTTVSIGP
ncbi:hypothetical protein D9758_013702 [Tetrapyrgos nigripes]|uniref:Uncharacterized protein n=1 Tax=Tetrapyrgos nigripes TaxID=182062 RepID=A0A8H5CJP8_9AGAR|nr:hypothetical protein D9758_013702 [Tetrapyrgos nigripes]